MDYQEIFSDPEIVTLGRKFQFLLNIWDDFWPLDYVIDFKNCNTSRMEEGATKWYGGTQFTQGIVLELFKLLCEAGYLGEMTVVYFPRNSMPKFPIIICKAHICGGSEMERELRCLTDGFKEDTFELDEFESHCVDIQLSSHK